MRIKHHISGLYKKILTLIGVLSFFVVGVFFVYALNTWNTGYRVIRNASAATVYGGNNGAVCKRVVNNCTMGDMFVPTKYDAEWQGTNGFINKAPSCVTISNCGCGPSNPCPSGQVCSGYVAPVVSPPSCLHWEKNTSELNQSISDAESQGCIEPLYMFPSIPSKPSFAPTYSGQMTNPVTISWTGTFYTSCNYIQGEVKGSAGDVFWQAISTPATSCVGQTSNGTPCTASSCTFVTSVNTPETMGQCVVPGCKANQDCSSTPSTPICNGYVPSGASCQGTFYDDEGYTTQGSCSYVGRCGANPGCSSYTTESACAGPQECNGPAGECDNSCFTSYPACGWTDGVYVPPSGQRSDCGQAFNTEPECRSEPACFWDEFTSEIMGTCGV